MWPYWLTCALNTVVPGGPYVPDVRPVRYVQPKFALADDLRTCYNSPMSKFDIEAIGRDYRSQLSTREIGRMHGCSETYVRKLAKKNKWQKGDLTEKIRARVHEKLAADNAVAFATEAEIIESSATHTAEIARLQRRDIQKLREIEQKLIAELSDEENPPKKVHISSYLGSVTQTALEIDVVGRSMAVSNLANVQHKRIQLERQALGLNDKPADLYADLPRDEVLRRLAELERKR